MELDPIMTLLVGLSLIVLVLGFFLSRFRQPILIGYILAGVLMGPQALGIISDEVTISRLGSIGVVILLFFVGMEVSLPRLVQKWKIAIIGTLVQIIVSVGFVWGIGSRFDWPIGRIVLLGFVISLSSTAVVLKVLEINMEMHTPVGRNVIGVLLVQDFAIVPMLIIIGLMGGESMNALELTGQVIGAASIIFLLAYAIKRPIRFPFARHLKKDHELELFMALSLCFGLALLTGVTGLSTALGAFTAGILVRSAKETRWVHKSLESFRIFFVALFFMSIGLLIDLQFLWENLTWILLLVLGVILTNTMINAGIFLAAGETLRESIYSGLLLSQIGEFSYVLAAVGLGAGLISFTGYQAAVAVISLSLLVSPFMILAARSLQHKI